MNRIEYIAARMAEDGLTLGEAMESAKQAGFHVRHDQVELLLTAVLSAKVALSYCGKVSVGNGLNLRALQAIEEALEAVRERTPEQHETKTSL